jgi:hypothetical protein
MDTERLAGAVSQTQAIEAVGWLSAELAARADAWNGNAPDWFPQPPEWLELWERALVATGDDSHRLPATDPGE